MDSGPESQYWLRVLEPRGGCCGPGTRAAVQAIIAALEDEHWRVREMAAKVIARHQVEESFEAVSALTEDPVPRVAQAAARAVRVLVESGA